MTFAITYESNVQYFKNYGLKESQIALLKKGNIQNLPDLLLAAPQDIAKRCKVSALEIKRILDVILELAPSPELSRLDSSCNSGDEMFTTGDKILDNTLGGGIRTGMIWEVVGESSAGKTQLALQLSLFVQLPVSLGGLLGSTCYLTTSSKLPTARLLQICQSNETLASSSCGLENVHTIAVPTVDVLQLVLTSIFPSFVEDQATTRNGRRVKLLVIDALAELFHSNMETTTSTLVERSKNITNISSSLHKLASSYGIAIVVLNEVLDRFDQSSVGIESQGSIYAKQSRWFNTAEFFGEKEKEASLGLAWANQVNVRIMLTRTDRRKYLNSKNPTKRHEDNAPHTTETESQPILIRRLSLIFGEVSSPSSVNYIVTEMGLIFMDDEHKRLESSVTEKRPAVNGVLRANDLKNEITIEEQDTLINDDGFWANVSSYDDFNWDEQERGLTQS